MSTSGSTARDERVRWARLAGLALAHDDADSCARLAGAAEALRIRVGAKMRQPFEEQCLSLDLTVARNVLGDEFAIRYAEGAALDAHEAVALAVAS